MPRLCWPFNPAGTLLLLLGAALFATVWLALLSVDPQIFREHGPMENFQIGCLLLGIVALGRSFFDKTDPARRIFCLGLMMFHATFIFHEFDTRVWNIPWLNFFFRGTSRNLILVFLWLLVFAAFLRRARPVWEIFVRWLPTSPGALMLIAGVCWNIGWVVEKSKFFAVKEHALMAEELFESFATLLMLIGAIWTIRAWSAERMAAQKNISTDKGAVASGGKPRALFQR